MLNHFRSRLRLLGASDAAIQRLERHALGPHETLQTGALICRSPREMNDYPVLLSGWAAKFHILPDGARQITAVLLPGDTDYVGRDRGFAIAEEIVALGYCKVARLASAALNALVKEDDDCASVIRSLAASEHAMLTSWLINLGRRDGYGRTAHFICEMHHRLSQLGMVTNGSFQMPLKQHDMADILGITAVHLHRKLQQLRRDGLVEVRAGTATVIDADRLRDVAGFDPTYLRSCSSGFGPTSTAPPFRGDGAADTKGITGLPRSHVPGGAGASTCKRPHKASITIETSAGFMMTGAEARSRGTNSGL